MTPPIRPSFGGAKGEEGRFRSDVAQALAKANAERATSIAAVEADVAALDTRLDTAETDIAALEAADLLLDGRLDTLEAAPTRVRAQRATSTQALTSGGTVTLIFNQEDEDTSAAYDPAAGTFTAPASGVYIVQTSLGIAFSSAAAAGFITITVNGAVREVTVIAIYSSTAAYGSLTGVLTLAANDVVRVQVTLPAGPVGPVLVAQPYANLSIRRL